MHELSQEVITIGSSEECLIVIKHEEVSNPHCLLMKDPDDVIWLYDCSKTGTRCSDGKWLQQDCVTLHTGDYFYLLWDEVDVSKRVGFCVLFVDDFKLLALSGESDKIKTTGLPLQPSSPKFMKPSTSNDDTDLENCLTCVICGDIYFECCRNRERITFTGGDYGLLRSSSGIFPIVPTITTTTTSSVSTGPIIMPTSLPMSAGCVICSWLPPSYDRRGNSMTSISGITLSDHGPRIEECSAHCYCTCCNRPMPSRTTTIPQLHGINRTECEVCRRTFCSLVNPYGCSTCDGYCLSRVQDLTRYNSIPRNLLLNNRIETRILDDYLTSKGVTIPTFINHCLTYYMNTTTISSLCTLNGNSLICKHCGERLLSQLAYQYRLTICSNELPNDVINKPNCYYGRYCRYQSYNYNHARRFNHICERSI
ncbi:hypothetical protein Smp_164690 [Schistosoma mansoni]|uniref:hypothetical protein n=1 Tax=Schistosoma mansoni TaxID=6183 RepID=UPI00022C8759|nr:hypothetical protein Smp_164690 [Schistosoma mansoni]|eukprot:XP_018645133.1 hypothetical protein Smp_164690 [Schistosoma mansoni]